MSENNNDDSQQQQQQNKVALPPTTSTSSTSQSKAHKSHSRFSTPNEWLSYVREQQLQKLSPEQRQNIQDRANKSQQHYAQAKKMTSVGVRCAKAKTSTYVSMDENISRSRHQAVLSSKQEAKEGEKEAPKTYSKKAEHLMDMMEEEDDFYRGSAFSIAPQQQQQQQLASAVPQTGAGASSSVARVSSSSLASPTMNMPVTAYTESQQMHTFYDHKGARPPRCADSDDDEDITVTEEQKALSSLKQEPDDDDQRAAKFETFVKFSDKIVVIRKDLDALVEETTPQLPPLPCEEMKKSVKRLDANECRGLHDRSRYWVVHDMLQKVSRNSDIVKDISEEISKKVRLLATLECEDCPVCLMPFLKSGEEVGDDDGDDEKVVPLVLSCLHRCCEVCWENIQEMRKAEGKQPICPLCRNEEWLEDLSATAEPA